MACLFLSILSVLSLISLCSMLLDDLSLAKDDIFDLCCCAADDGDVGRRVLPVLLVLTIPVSIVLNLSKGFRELQGPLDSLDNFDVCVLVNAVHFSAGLALDCLAC